MKWALLWLCVLHLALVGAGLFNRIDRHRGASGSRAQAPQSTDGDDREYKGLIIQDFADWCLRNNLQINAGKTKELVVVDFCRRSHSQPAPVSIQGTDIDTVKSYKARPSYDSVVASAIFYTGIVCWASSITDRDRRRMDRLDTLTALGSSFSERLLPIPRCVCEGEYKRHLSTTSNSQTPNSTMAKTKELSKDTRNKIVDLHQAGKTESAIVHVQARLKFAREHLDDPEEDWENVIWFIITADKYY
ncbi:hypothetical protein L3Q82_004578 [Scortum barcoo]|uniref:Uncharacterized protein n=1 Tax=Scortum barcoo TaxID=214431 RepID=A0ACB8VJN9_9TELE|nr:hypothetical protein L3Q82_004578 [Scortum barcoo]